MPVASRHPADLHAPLHPSDLIALESTAWASSVPELPGPLMRVYPQATAEGMAAIAQLNPDPIQAGYRRYRTSSW